MAWGWGNRGTEPKGAIPPRLGQCLNQHRAWRLQHLYKTVFGVSFSAYRHLQPKRDRKGLGWVVVSVIMGYANTSQPGTSQHGVRPVSTSCAKLFLPNPYEILGRAHAGPTSPSISWAACRVRGEKQGRWPWIL